MKKTRDRYGAVIIITSFFFIILVVIASIWIPHYLSYAFNGENVSITISGIYEDTPIGKVIINGSIQTFFIYDLDSSAHIGDVYAGYYYNNDVVCVETVISCVVTLSSLIVLCIIIYIIFGLLLYKTNYAKRLIKKGVKQKARIVGITSNVSRQGPYSIIKCTYNGDTYESECIYDDISNVEQGDYVALYLGKRKKEYYIDHNDTKHDIFNDKFTIDFE